jgi:hypothetical protein
MRGRFPVLYDASSSGGRPRIPGRATHLRPPDAIPLRRGPPEWRKGGPLLCYHRKRGRVRSIFPLSHPALWYAAHVNWVSRSLSREKLFQLSIWVLQKHPFLPGLVEKQVADQLAVVLAPYLTEIDRWEWLYPSALKTDAKLFSQLTVLCKREGRSVLPAVLLVR